MYTAKGSGQTSCCLVLCGRKYKKQQLASACVCPSRVSSSFSKITYWRQSGIFLFQIFGFIYVENTARREYKEKDETAGTLKQDCLL